MFDRIEGRFVHGDDVYLDDYYMGEAWGYISGFPEYMVSNLGRVWSEKTQRFLTVKPMDAHGHLGVCLRKDGRAYYKYIHRLVAEAFIPNPNNYPIVRHIYDQPDQNTEWDLAWGTMRDNARDSIRNGHAYIPTDEDRYKGNKDRMIPVVAIDLETQEKIYFESQGQAGRVLGIPQANIWKVLAGERRSAGGYKFEEVKS